MESILRFSTFLLIGFIFSGGIRACFPTKSATSPVVSSSVTCSCNTSDVALLDDVDGTPGDDDTILPVGTATLDTSGCATDYVITCTPTTGTNVIIQFQDQLGGAIESTTVTLSCSDGDWIYSSDSVGDILVASVQCTEY